MIGPYDLNQVHCADALEGLAQLPDESVQCVITSPPYWGLRSYLPDVVMPKPDTSQWVFHELKERGVFPLDGIVG